MKSLALPWARGGFIPHLYITDLAALRQRAVIAACPSFLGDEGNYDRRSEPQHRISAASWNRSVAALERFCGWGSRRGTDHRLAARISHGLAADRPSPRSSPRERFGRESPYSNLMAVRRSACFVPIQSCPLRGGGPARRAGAAWAKMASTHRWVCRPSRVAILALAGNGGNVTFAHPNAKAMGSAANDYSGAVRCMNSMRFPKGSSTNRRS
jgi:hypothetical protein